jgi:hypothetical protein
MVEMFSVIRRSMGRLADLGLLLAICYIYVRGAFFTLSGLHEILHAEMQLFLKLGAAAVFVLVMAAFLLPASRLQKTMARAFSCWRGRAFSSSNQGEGGFR